MSPQISKLDENSWMNQNRNTSEFALNKSESINKHDNEVVSWIQAVM